MDAGPFYIPNKTEYTVSPGDILEVDLEQIIYGCTCCYLNGADIRVDATKLRYIGTIEPEAVGAPAKGVDSIKRILRLYEVLPGASGVTEVRADYVFYNNGFPELLATVTILGDPTPTPEVTVTTPNPTTVTPTPFPTTTQTPIPTVTTTYWCTIAVGGPWFSPIDLEYSAEPGDFVDVTVEERNAYGGCYGAYYPYRFLHDESKLRFIGQFRLETLEPRSDNEGRRDPYTRIDNWILRYEVLPGASGVTLVDVDVQSIGRTTLGTITIGDGIERTPTPVVSTTIPPTTSTPEPTTATATPPVSVPPTTAVATSAVPTATTPSPVPTITPMVTTATVTTATPTPSPTPVPLPEVAVVLLGNGEGSIELDRNQDARLDAADLISTAR